VISELPDCKITTVCSLPPHGTRQANPKQLVDALNEPSPKESIIEIILATSSLVQFWQHVDEGSSHSAHDIEAVAVAAKQFELRQMKLGALLSRAKEDQIPDDAIKQAIDSGGPRLALRNLILAHS
jgi:hypothetical protein